MKPLTKDETIQVLKAVVSYPEDKRIKGAYFKDNGCCCFAGALFKEIAKLRPKDIIIPNPKDPDTFFYEGRASLVSSVLRDAMPHIYVGDIVQENDRDLPWEVIAKNI